MRTKECANDDDNGHCDDDGNNDDDGDDNKIQARNYRDNGEQNMNIHE